MPTWFIFAGPVTYIVIAMYVFISMHMANHLYTGRLAMNACLYVYNIMVPHNLALGIAICRLVSIMPA